MRTPYLSARLQGFGTTVFAEMSALALATGAVNLGQGFPDEPGPDEVLDVARAAIGTGLDQYPPGPGLPVLREAIAAHQLRFRGLTYDPDAEVLVTAGATEALAGALLGLLDTGDEVVVFEPMYDSYAAGIAMAGAVARPVPLRPPAPGGGGVWEFDPVELRAAVTGRTRVVLLNTPHNPTGKVFSRAELQLVADLAVEHDLLVLTDEVYEHLVFSGSEHVSIATLPGMRERTLVVSSGGKTFHTTGWKIGWVCGPAALVAAVRTAKQFLTYVNGGPFQPAIAAGLGLPDAYFHRGAAVLERRRDLLLTGLAAAGLPAIAPQGTYFATVDVRGVQPDGDGWAFCRELPGRVGVVAVPTVVFYDPSHAHLGRHLVRFAFCKRDEVVADAARRLSRLA
ncbi:pyridoxal phosphate-dependent aminotransferase [Modestobacter sp. I12A-02628]|uniref:Pyridoxal phosphate-dependent aminotransferase n=1 Tax=Goekera deserti TaxID=2497753 RepID=A0A7K3WFI1_9ACTN|nr:pyridoxal phosphate-dependent aminotransferase [Goekera deserti]MPR00097.1 pyridoxal phosphate-dependent aminotransferase [Goekera deserti]NDI49876.1 pyridoxal phosphate-dependent aminotransferase [Goekera deserti]NEL55238.1 pyridoxal phosphate-dependent aminotransferase [Goekera deserti]